MTTWQLITTLKRATTTMHTSSSSRVLLLLMMTMTMTTISLVQGSAICPPLQEDEPSFDEIVYYSDVVVQGEVLRQVPSGPKAAPGRGPYAARLKILCVFKGQRIPREISISDAGNASDPCKEQFVKGERYLAFLFKQGHDVYAMAYPHYPDTAIDEIYSTCNINITYPEGVDEKTNEIKCEFDPDYFSDDTECVTFTPIDGKKAKNKVTAPSPPGKVEKVEQTEEDEEENDSSASLPLQASPLFAFLLCAVSFRAIL